MDVPNTLPKTNSRFICWTLANCKFFWIRFLRPKASTSPPPNALRVRVWNLFHPSPSPPECFDKGHKIVNTPIPFSKDVLSQEPGGSFPQLSIFSVSYSTLPFPIEVVINSMVGTWWVEWIPVPRLSRIPCPVFNITRTLFVVIILSSPW